MISQWTTVTFGEVVKLEQGLCFNKKTNHLMSDTGIPLLRIADLINNTQTKFVDEKRVPPKYIACPKDIIYTRTGQVGLVFKGKIGIVHNNCFRIVPKDIIDKDYVYWYLRQSSVIQHARSLAGGAAQPDLGHDAFKSILFSYPDLKTQRKIAAILSAYDDLIENNLRRIKILEEMAQNLYREWFVKFRFPGHENAKFVDSPLGLIPDGWEVKTISSLIQEHIGGGWGQDIEDNRYTEPAWVIRGTDIPEARFCNFPNVPLRYHTKSNLSSRRLVVDDIIFEVSGGSKGQPLGRSLYISSELLSTFKSTPVICASFCKRIKPDSKQYNSKILYLSFLDAYMSGEIEQYQVQSTGISNYKWSEYIEKVNRCIPPITLQNYFDNLVVPLFSKIANLGQKNTILYQTRDLLLPKLISGELDVSELDIVIPEEILK